jgi:hypothetical protein
MSPDYKCISSVCQPLPEAPHKVGAAAEAELKALHRKGSDAGWPPHAYLAIATAIERHRPDDPVAAHRWRRLALLPAAAIEEVGR